MRNPNTPRLLLLVLFVATVTSGCGAVMSTEMMGTDPVTLDADDWDGIWFTGEAVAIMRVDTSRGVVQVLGADEDIFDALEDDEDDYGPFEVVLRKAGDLTFFTLTNGFDLSPDQQITATTVDGEGSPQHLWGVIENDGNQIAFWAPNLAKFRDLVRRGILPGTIDGEDVTLQPLELTHYDLITSDSTNVLFDWKKPGTFVRLTR